MAVDAVEEGAELERLREGLAHVERGLAHVRAAQAIVAPRSSLAGAPLQTVRGELAGAASQLKSSLIIAGRMPIGAALVDEAAAAVVPLEAPPSVTVSAHRVVAERRVIINLSYGDGAAVLMALMDVLESGDGGLKRSVRARVERVCELLEPRVARARRARRVAA